MISKGYYISITPDVLYETDIRQLVAQYPIELMMVATDGPWPFEAPFEGMRTHPVMIINVIKLLKSNTYLNKKPPPPLCTTLDSFTDSIYNREN
jgi:TatD DNase family protein